MYRRLRRIRVYVSAAYLMLLTFAVIDASFALTYFGAWLMRVQLMTAILAGSVMWVVLWVVLTLWVGRVYCSSVCPLGTVQDCAAHLGRRLGKGACARYTYSPAIDSLRIPVPVIVAACFFLGITAVVEYTDPFELYSRLVLGVARPAMVTLGSAAAAAIVVFVICAVAWRRGRLVCNTVCPAGGLLALLARHPVYAVDIDTDKCIHCGRCAEVCKSECIDLHDCVVDSSRCVMCLNCTAVCPNDAITVRRGHHRLSIPMMQRISLKEAVLEPDTEISSHNP